MQQQQPRVRLGRVYDERTAEDGTRVLVDRLWPRGLTKDRADLDEWCKQITPSPALRKWYGHAPDRFAELSRRYRQELDDPGRVASGPRPSSSATVTTATCTSARKASRSAGVIARDMIHRLGLPQCGVMETVAVVLMVLGL